MDRIGNNDILRGGLDNGRLTDKGKDRTIKDKKVRVKGI